MKTIDELLAEGVAGKRVFVRADLNVPLSGTTITDDGRIRAVLPTVKALADAGARVVVASHLGRPKGAPDPAFSSPRRPPASVNSWTLPWSSRPTRWASRPPPRSRASPTARSRSSRTSASTPHETSKDDAERGAFADQLAALADVYVGDGFGAVHRKHASVFDLPARLPHYAGHLIATEVGVLKKLTDDVQRPYVVVLGGAKVSDKLAVIDELLGKADRILIGGGMAFTFLKAKGHEVGASLLQEDQIPAVLEYIERAEKTGVELVLPVDAVVAPAFPDLKTKAPADSTTVAADAIPADRMGLDIGPASGKLYASKITDAATVFWNGPMGVFEHPEFAEGTKAVAQALLDSPAFTVVGGGDSAAAVRTLGFDENAFGHISTGGGASLEYLEGKTLPGLAALED